MEPLLADARYKGAYGGRGSMKSHFFAEMAVERHIMWPGTRGVCIREVQQSLDQSVKLLLEDKIRAMGVSRNFRIYDSEIRCPGEGLIIFKGMQHYNADNIKSLEGFDWGWVEEAQTLSDKSLRLLRPTIRKDPTPTWPGSELWFSWNPEDPESPVDHFFRGNGKKEKGGKWEPHPDAIVVRSNWRDNPWFPEVLRKEKDYDFRVDPDTAAHVWDGEYWLKSDAQVLSGKWRVEEFTPPASDHRHPDRNWNGPYHGVDWGFANDPTALVRFWVSPDGGLWIEREAYQLGCDLLDTPGLFETAVPDIRKYLMRADCARPETISHMTRVGFRCEGAPKWQGSVEDGIAWLRRRPYIVIHPRCQHVSKEAKMWRYKTDKLTGDVLPKLVEGHDHTWDAVRYGAAPLIQESQKSYTLLQNL
jgi:phage terminase large subunit